MVVVEEKEEINHLMGVLHETQQALQESDSFKLHELSDQIIHSASIYQHTDVLTVAVVIYSLHKIVTRKDQINPRDWNAFVKKFNAEIEKALTAFEERDGSEATRHIDHAKELLEITIGKKLGAYVQDVLKKASVNKATKMYEHGISLSHTAHLLGLTQWDLLEYVGQREPSNSAFSATIDQKKRAAKARAFFE